MCFWMQAFKKNGIFLKCHLIVDAVGSKSDVLFPKTLLHFQQFIFKFYANVHYYGKGTTKVAYIFINRPEQLFQLTCLV